MLCLVLSAACVTPAVTSAVFAQEFEETSPYETEFETETTVTTDESKEDSTDIARTYDWEKEPGTIYEAKLYLEELNDMAETELPEEEKAAVEAAIKSMETYLSDRETEVMYRVYNPNSSEHFYTANPEERQMLIDLGWDDEGIAWLAPKNKGADVYRLYNPNGEHHFTLNAAERDGLVKMGWDYEGVGWKSADPEDKNNIFNVFREYNPNEYKCNHNYTTSAREHRMLTKAIGWDDEGIGWYAISPVSRIQQEDGSWKIYNNETMEQLTGEQEIGGEMLFLDPANEGKAFTGIRKKDGKTYIYDDKGNQMFGLVDYDNSTYMLDLDKGFAITGQQLLDEKTDEPRYVCFDEDGKMIKGRTVNGVRYAEDGTKLDLTPDESLMLKSIAIYNKAGRDLHAVYNWTYQNISYTRFNPEWQTPPEGWTHEQNFANIGLTDRRGNAYTFAATFARLAQNLGYNAQFVKGEILLTTGWSEHGWVKINLDGKDYLFDPTFERSLKGDGNLCWKQDADHPKYQYRTN